MAGRQPGEAAGRGDGVRRPESEAPATEGPSLLAPLGKSLLIAAAGTAGLIVVAAVFASTVGLLFVSATMGAAIGLVLARARVPDHDGRTALGRGTVRWLAIAIAVAAVLVAAVGTWLIAREQGGTLDPIDYLLTTFGPFVPAELVLAALAAAWGASAGPVQS